MASNSNRRYGSSDSRARRRSSASGSRPTARSASSRARASQRSAGSRAAYRPSNISRTSSRRPTQRVSSVSIGELNRASSAGRRSSSPAVSSGGIRRVIIVFVLLVLLAIAGTVVYWSSLFTVSQVTVSGCTHLTASEMTELAQVPSGTTLLRVDAGAIEKRLESDAWVEDAAVNRIFPDTLELVITERSIAAVVTITSVSDQQSEDWAIASDGTWLMKIPEQGSAEAANISQQIYEDAESVLHITDVPYGVNPQVGSVCTDESVINALTIVSSLSTELADSVTTVSATDSANTVLTLSNGVQIAFGEAENIRDKERVCLELMEQHPDAISYINVRVVTSPTYRALSS